MALRDQPYFPLYVQDYLTDEKLNLCSAATQGIYIKILCIFHKSEKYGGILLKQKDKQNQNNRYNFAEKLSKLLTFSCIEIDLALTELLDEKVLFIEDDYLFQKRMIKDNDISIKRSESGKKGGDNSFKKVNNLLKQNNKQNTENENEDVNKDIDVNKKKGEDLKKVPSLLDFTSYALEQEPLLEIQSIKLKYESWKVAGWKAGKDLKPIKNWKTTLLNTIPYLTKNNTQPTISKNEQRFNKFQESSDESTRILLEKYGKQDS